MLTYKQRINCIVCIEIYGYSLNLMCAELSDVQYNIRNLTQIPSRIVGYKCSPIQNNVNLNEVTNEVSTTIQFSISTSTQLTVLR